MAGGRAQGLDRGLARAKIGSSCLAGVAQLVEQLIRNQQVSGSNPLVGSTFPALPIVHGQVRAPVLERAALINSGLVATPGQSSRRPSSRQAFAFGSKTMGRR